MHCKKSYKGRKKCEGEKIEQNELIELKSNISLNRVK